MFRLEQNAGDPLPLPAGKTIVIGRGDQCDFQLNDPSASRVHCQVIAEDGRVTLTDAGSRWGTLVNGQQVTRCELRSGDEITVGETILQLVLENDANRTTVAPRTVPGRQPDVSDVASDVARQASSRPGSSPTAHAAPGPYGEAATDHRPHGTDRSRPSPGRPRSDMDTEITVLQPSDFTGRSFLRYSILETVAATTSGLVFRASEESTGHPVALKIFHPSGFADETAKQRFERAARTMFGQRQANIVELYNAGRKEGLCFTASEFVKGDSAVELIRRIGIAGMLEPSKVMQIAVDLCEALRFAESKGIVHRNITPSNILVRTADGTALLNDLILAKATNLSHAEQLTQAGDILGDVSYLSPEQLGSGHPLDCRSDIYQLGASLYALLTGRPPASGGTVGELIAHVLSTPPPPVRERHMATPPQFETLVLKMLSKQPRDRYQTAEELSAALRTVCAATGHHRIQPRQSPDDAAL